MQEEPKPFGEVSIEVEEEELTRTSGTGKSKKSHEGDDHIIENPLKKRKEKATKTPIVQRLSISTKTKATKGPCKGN
jgi:ribosomal protein L35